MIKQPLFGQDSSPHKTSSFLSAVITFVFWLIMTVAGVFIKIKPASPKYKEIQIVLSSTPAAASVVPEALEGQAESASAQVFEENLESSQSEQLPENTSVVPEATSVVPEALEGPAKVETTPVAEAKVETPKKTEATTKTNTTPKTKETPADKKVSYEIVKSVDELMEEQLSTKKTSTMPDWWNDDTDAVDEPQVSQQVKTVTTQSSIQGSAGQTSANKNQSQTSQSANKSQAQQSASSATSDALKNIRNTTYSTSSGSSTKSITEAKTTKGSDGTLSMAMKDGSTRVLVNPVPPVIKLSDSAAALIDTTRTVTIEFHVLSSGNVPRGEVTITPVSLLPDDVRKEILDQLSKWQFESSAADARATFEYTIEKQ